MLCFFSYAYIQLTTATGALILFGTVQVSLLSWALINKQKLTKADWFGLLAANAGLLILLLPGAQQPALSAVLLMVVAGIAWAAYTWVGRGSVKPLEDTRTNFLLTLPLVLILIAYLGFNQMIHWQPTGVCLAILSGSLASGVAYACWYKVLPSLNGAQAGTVQLLGPVLAGAGGILLLGEPLNLRLLLSSLLILGGVALSILVRR